MACGDSGDNSMVLKHGKYAKALEHTLAYAMNSALNQPGSAPDAGPRGRGLLGLARTTMGSTHAVLHHAQDGETGASPNCLVPPGNPHRATQ